MGFSEQSGTPDKNVSSTLPGVSSQTRENLQSGPDHPACGLREEFTKKDHMNFGVLMSTSNPVIADAFRKALRFWSHEVDLSWYEAHSSDACAVEVMDDKSGILKGTFDTQMHQLSTYITSNTLTSGQKTEFLNIFNKLTEKNIRLETLNNSTLELVIKEKCNQSVDDLHKLLQDVRNGLSDGNPLKTYETPIFLALAQFTERKEFEGQVVVDPKAFLTAHEWYLTAVHEIGHVLGLEHNKKNKLSIMYDFDLAGSQYLTSQDLAALDKLHKLRVSPSQTILVSEPPDDAKLMTIPPSKATTDAAKISTDAALTADAIVKHAAKGTRDDLEQIISLASANSDAGKFALKTELDYLNGVQDNPNWQNLDDVRKAREAITTLEEVLNSREFAGKSETIARNAILKAAGELVLDEYPAGGINRQQPDERNLRELIIANRSLAERVSEDVSTPVLKREIISHELKITGGNHVEAHGGLQQTPAVQTKAPAVVSKRDLH